MDLLSKIENRSATVGIIGLGYVGLPLIIEFGKAKFAVIGFDLDEKKIKSLKKQEHQFIQDPCPGACL